MGSSERSRSATVAILVSLVIGWAAISSIPLGNAFSQEYLSFTFFLHDYAREPNGTTAFPVLPPISGYTNQIDDKVFGLLAVFDDALTVGPDRSTLEIGKGRGLQVFAANDTKGPGLEFLWTAEFNEASGYGEGSTLTFKGFDRILNQVREIAIVGGTGKFRLARGWAIITTYSYVISGSANVNITPHVFYGY